MSTLVQFQLRKDTAANWASNNPVLLSGEPGYDTTNKILKIGDGSTAWNSLVGLDFDIGYYVPGGALGTPTSGNASNLTNFPTLNQNTSGNAATATSATTAGSAATLTTSRNINGVAFNASADITIPIPADFMLVQVGNVARATGSGDFAVAHRVGRAFTATSVIYQFDTADASGSTTVELRRNGSQVASSSVAVTAANQVDGTGTDAARTVTISQSFSVGDRINLQITGVGTTPGKGLRAWIVGTWN